MWLCGGMAQMRLEVSWGRLGTPSLHYTGLLQPLLWGVREGDIWEGFPTQVQEEEQTSVSLESSVARPVRGCCSHPWVGNWACLWFMFCSGRQLFPRKVTCQSSKPDLADPREKEIYLHFSEETRVFKRQNQGVPGRSQGQFWAGSLAPALWAIAVARTHAALLPHSKGSWALRELPNKLPLRGVSRPPRGAAGLELASPSLQASSQGSSRVKVEELAPAKLDRVGQGPRVA